jgi:hypothetical protein
MGTTAGLIEASADAHVYGLGVRLLEPFYTPVGVFTLQASWSVGESVFRCDTFQCILKYWTTANPLSTEEENSAFVQDYKRKSCTITIDISAFMLKPG